MHQNSSHNDLPTGPLSWLWCLMLGPIYFLMKGKWRHALVSFSLTIVTGALSSWLYGLLAAWLVYPLLVEGINASTRSRESLSVVSSEAEGSRLFFASDAADHDDDGGPDADAIDAMIARQKARRENEQAERREAERARAAVRTRSSGEPRGFGRRRTPPSSASRTRA